MKVENHRANVLQCIFNTNMVKIVYSDDFQNKSRVYLPKPPSPSMPTAQYTGFGPWVFVLCENLSFFTPTLYQRKYSTIVKKYTNFSAKSRAFRVGESKVTWGQGILKWMSGYINSYTTIVFMFCHSQDCNFMEVNRVARPKYIFHF